MALGTHATGSFFPTVGRRPPGLLGDALLPQAGEQVLFLPPSKLHPWLLLSLPSAPPQLSYTRTRAPFPALAVAELTPYQELAPFLPGQMFPLLESNTPNCCASALPHGRGSLCLRRAAGRSTPWLDLPPSMDAPPLWFCLSRVLPLHGIFFPPSSLSKFQSHIGMPWCLSSSSLSAQQPPSMQSVIDPYSSVSLQSRAAHALQVLDKMPMKGLVL
jgi:hypothetical protein|uniref:Uncharacterized protein n=1 Tax=Zea mays TaxID=4577 RepID=A0A804N380_MAIZE